MQGFGRQRPFRHNRHRGRGLNGNGADVSSMPPPSIHILAMTETYGIAGLECDDLLRGNAQPHLLTRHLTRRPTDYGKRLALVLPILHAHRDLSDNRISGFIPFELSHLTAMAWL